MKDKALFSIFTGVMNKCLAKYGVDYDLIKGYQPTKQGRVDDGIYYHDLGVVRIGIQSREYDLPVDPDNKNLIMRDSLPTAKMIQVSTFVKDNPSDMEQLTAVDLCEVSAMIISSLTFIDEMRKHSIGIEKVSEILQPNFINEQDQFEASPSFTFIMTLPRRIELEVGVVSEVKQNIHRV